MATTLLARQIGARAHAAILDLDTWFVLASVSGAIYLESDAGEILWIAASSSALHPRAILLPDMPAELPPVGTMCSLGNGYLHVGSNLVIRLSDAELWCPEWGLRSHKDAIEAPLRITAAIDQAAFRSPPQGLFASVALPRVPRSDRGACNAVEQMSIAMASRGIESLCQASTELDLLGQLQDAVDLVGLGQGLTPSGDDLLGGFLYTHHVLDSSYWRSLGSDLEGVDGWLQEARSLTNKISFAILADHAHGDAAAPLHDFLNAALNERPLEYLVQAACRVSAIGQSSGWDMLAGVYCASAAVERMVDHDSACCISHSGRTGKRKVRQEDQHSEEVVHVC